ncbi:MAG: hypothetical protein HZB47_01075 [Nitrosomonadales bacterium]|nr:hypothetical protein [Nitrosomonadales bacterium]
MDKWLMYGQPKEVESKKTSIVKEYIVPLGTLLIAILTFFTQSALPVWGGWAIGVYVVIVAVFLVVPVIARNLRRLNAWVKRSRLEKGYLLEIVEAFRKFQPMVDTRRSDNLWGVWQNATRIETQKHIRPNHSHFNAISTWHEHLNKTIASAKNADFQATVAESAAWVQQYISLCRDAYAQFENLLRDKDNQVNESTLREIKQSWNHVRDDHNRAVSGWLSLCEEINSSFGQNVCSTFYETLRPLE